MFISLVYISLLMKEGELLMHTHRELQEVLAEGDAAVWRDLADSIAAKYEIHILKEPETCLVMSKAQDTVGNAPFYLGEVLITEAAVAINGVTGYGHTLEEDPVKALCIAVIQSALAAGLPETGHIQKVIEAEKARILNSVNREQALIDKTKVRFAIMEG